MGTHPIFESDFDCLTKYQDPAEAKNFLRNKRREHDELRALFQERPKELARFADAADRQLTQIAWGWLCYLIFGIPLVTLAMNYLFNITMNLPVEAPMVGNMQFVSDPRRNQLRQRYEVENLEKIKINFTQDVATPEEIAASRVFLEKELFERVAVLQELV